jgi:hypothetical protein
MHLRVARASCFFSALFLVIGVLGCGYSAPSYLGPGGATIAVPTFENKTLWRGREFELTHAVTKNILERTSYRIASKESADLILEGEILEYRTPGLLDDRVDRVLQSQLAMQVNVRLVNKAGEVLTEKNAWFAAEFSSRRGESEATARAEAMEKAARWVVTCLESPWR